MSTSARIKDIFKKILYRNKAKYFCIGRNKTGTTSLKKAFSDLGFSVGSQRRAELLIDDYKARNFSAIIDYCKTAEVFQDFPFSFPNTYKEVDRAFPGSKFILTIRDSPEAWYNSLVRFHGKKFGKGNIPTAEDLKMASYVRKGWMWECNRLLYQTPEDTPYDKTILMKAYEAYNEEIMTYFADRPEDLLVINLKNNHAYRQFCDFLNVDSTFTEFPWENKTKDIPVK